MEIKQTPFTITNGMIEKIAEIAELTGRISAVTAITGHLPKHTKL